MKRHLRARVSGGLLLPLEPIGISDGSKIDLTMDVPESAKTIPATNSWSRRRLTTKRLRGGGAR